MWQVEASTAARLLIVWHGNFSRKYFVSFQLHATLLTADRYMRKRTHTHTRSLVFGGLFGQSIRGQIWTRTRCIGNAFGACDKAECVQTSRLLGWHSAGRQLAISGQSSGHSIWKYIPNTTGVHKQRFLIACMCILLLLLYYCIIVLTSSAWRWRRWWRHTPIHAHCKVSPKSLTLSPADRVFLICCTQLGHLRNALPLLLLLGRRQLNHLWRFGVVNLSQSANKSNKQIRLKRRKGKNPKLKRRSPSVRCARHIWAIGTWPAEPRAMSSSKKTIIYNKALVCA